ncbi:teichoic acid transporter [Bacteroidia bacterium]|nr:teichoic acid transporter [Bacteroidia bacterium]
MEKIKKIIKQIGLLWKNNPKVVENYFFMTFSQGAIVLINLLLYPYLIRTLGKEAYGTYIFIFSNINLFILFIAAGLSTPALKKIAINTDSLTVKSQTVSEVFTAKLFLFCIYAVLLAVCILFIPFVRANITLYLIVFVLSSSDMLFPLWYFQGMQKMGFVTCVNLGIRILIVPLVFIFIKSSANLLEYTLIVSVLPFLGGVFTFFYLITKEHLRIRLVSFKSLKPVFRDSLPFFWTTAFGRIKDESIKFFVGILFGMNNVAVYDLANKIITLVSMFTGSINTAIFPVAVKKLGSERIKQIFRYETIIGLSATAAIVAFGYWAVLLLGGKAMLNAYPLTVILSITIYTNLIVGCYFNLVFVPQERYYFITRNQIVSLITFVAFSGTGLLLFQSIDVIVIALSLSAICEVLYCKFLTTKHKLL